MKVKNLFLIVVLTVFSKIDAQTKWIFHKSHSGANTTMFADTKNNFGPGMLRIDPRLEKPISPIQLQYKVKNGVKYPMIKLDSASKIIRYIDVNDSLIGCDRNYTEYLTEGYVFFDLNTNKYCLYKKAEHNEFVFVINPKKLDKWTKATEYRVVSDYIYSGRYTKIKIDYLFKFIKPNINSVEEEIAPSVLKTKKKPLKKKTNKPLRIENNKRDSVQQKQNIILPVVSIPKVGKSLSIPYRKTPLYIFGFIVLLAFSLGMITLSRFKSLK